jgi:NAD+ synthase (glutamine-hydrolysing)
MSWRIWPKEAAMNIALVQMDVRAGDPQTNTQRMVQFIHQAKAQGADLVVFPEMCVGGYFVGDAWLEEGWLRELEAMNPILQEAAQGITLVYGNVAVDYQKRGYDGRPTKYNAAYVVQGDRVSYEAKTLLPNYRIFDDKRYFIPREDYPRPLFDVAGKKFGVTVCEDMWSNDYESDPVIELIQEGADFILNISASPWTYGKNSSRDKQIKILENKAHRFVPFYYVNNVGVQNNGKNLITFDGDTAVYAQGERLHNYDLDPYQEGIILIDHAKLQTGGERGLPSRIEQKYHALLRGIRGFDELLGGWNPNFVIGLSGGVDSSLVAVLMSRALGPKRILGFNLPSQYNSDLTKDAAAKLARNLGISYKTIPIEEMVEVNRRLLAMGTGEFSPLIDENIQAKIRGTSILSNLAPMNNALMTNNGNKLEIALGYATLYGDVNGGLAPIGDLTKEEVFEMCRWINRDEEIIPTELLPDENWDFVIAPSAELKENQRDPIKFGYHDKLIEKLMDYRKVSPEDVLGWYQEGKEGFLHHLGMSASVYELYGLGDPEVFVKDLEWFVRTMRGSIFKRIQAPPIILVSKTAFGYDLRESQFPWTPSLEFTRRKARVLEG